MTTLGESAFTLKDPNFALRESAFTLRDSTRALRQRPGPVEGFLNDSPAPSV